MKKNAILFFGASVTAQSRGNGFFEPLAALLGERGIAAERKAFGSCHLDDAGFYAVPEIDFSRYDWCVLDWNTTGMAVFTASKLGFIMRSMLLQRCVPVIAILPQDRNLDADRVAERQMIELAVAAGLPLIDLRTDFQREGLLRDWVHTTPAGGQHYADRLLAFIETLGAAAAPDRAGMLAAVSRALPVIDFSFSTDAKPRTVSEGQRLVIDYRGATPNSELLFDMVIGPFSPVIEVDINGRRYRTIAIWDQWCHYERDFQRVITTQGSLARQPQGQIVVSISPNKLPDYAGCRAEGFSFTGIRKLVLKRVQATQLEITVTVD